jgi:putative transposase
MHYRRLRIPGATYFFTFVIAGRRPLLRSAEAVADYQAAVEAVRASWPLEVEAEVILPDHLHVMWSLPEGDADFSTRVRLIKSRFVRSVAPTVDAADTSESRRSKCERSIWQRRFWEHVVSDERDFAAHLHYIHYNPVRHGLVAAPRDWPYSTFHKWVERGIYELDWGSDVIPRLPPNIGGEWP